VKLCRFDDQGLPSVAFYYEHELVPFQDAAEFYALQKNETVELSRSSDILTFLPPEGRHSHFARQLHEWLESRPDERERIVRPLSKVRLLVPNPRPNKLFLLAGNYAKHIEEGGGIAAERAETFPYVFMKPPSTTLTDPAAPIVIPKVSPNSIDWELELGVVIGKPGKRIPESDALSYVAGYTVFNDISDRKFRPNPDRKPRDKDAFFDWLHGKWHDSSCPCGPCIVSPDEIPDPQNLAMTLRVNGQTFQDASTAQQIFPVAAVISFISSFVTLEPGDMISTGTAAGVGNTTGTYLKPGDLVEATIEGIGTLRNPVVAEL
jgi:2,4-didehydro-3-deoxy-L-rhamnonate hydrolase